jgi:hypothetical protein
MFYDEEKGFKKRYPPGISWNNTLFLESYLTLRFEVFRVEGVHVSSMRCSKGSI